MKDGLDIVNDVWGLVNVVSVRDLLGVGGMVHKFDKPGGRGLTMMDVVIDSPAITNDQQQKGIAYINIFAPSIIATQPDGSKQAVPNVAKLTAIKNAIYPLVDSIDKPTFRLWIEDPGTLLKDADGSYFISMELNYYSIQTNFKHV